MGIIKWLREILLSGSQFPMEEKSQKPEGMNQGDFHSGPQGYSPGTSYPETFYGSAGSSNQEDTGSTSHNEGDFNR
jgi:hypothetical protein